MTGCIDLDVSRGAIRENNYFEYIEHDLVQFAKLRGNEQRQL
jgi:hypothetical protein